MSESVYIRELKQGDVVTVETKNHVYTLKILDPEKKKVKMTSSHPRFSGLYTCTIEGSTQIEALYPVKYDHIEIGQRLLFTPMLWLSPTKSISVNGTEIFPKK